MAWVQDIFDKLFDPNTYCVAFISHGKDSNAMLRAIQLLGLPLHGIVTSDVWATQDIPADLPEMWAWKKQADKRILELYGVPVTHICATEKCSQNGNAERENNTGRCLRRLSFQDLFYRELQSGKFIGTIKGFPLTLGGWCKNLKYGKIDFSKAILHQIEENWNNMGFPFLSRNGMVPRFEAFSSRPRNEGQKINIVRYLGIAADEQKRIAKHIGKNDVVLPLVEIGWEEDLCGLISKYQGLLSPTYESAARDGCWFAQIKA